MTSGGLHCSTFSSRFNNPMMSDGCNGFSSDKNVYIRIKYSSAIDWFNQIIRLPLIHLQKNSENSRKLLASDLVCDIQFIFIYGFNLYFYLIITQKIKLFTYFSPANLITFECMFSKQNVPTQSYSLALLNRKIAINVPLPMFYLNLWCHK